MSLWLYKHCNRLLWRCDANHWRSNNRPIFPFDIKLIYHIGQNNVFVNCWKAAMEWSFSTVNKSLCSVAHEVRPDRGQNQRCYPFERRDKMICRRFNITNTASTIAMHYAGLMCTDMSEVIDHSCHLMTSVDGRLKPIKKLGGKNVISALPRSVIGATKNARYHLCHAAKEH